MKGVCLQYVAELYLTRELSRLFNVLKSDLMSFKGIKFLESADVHHHSGFQINQSGIEAQTLS